jgi:hypothetical protein
MQYMLAIGAATVEAAAKGAMPNRDCFARRFSAVH